MEQQPVLCRILKLKTRHLNCSSNFPWFYLVFPYFSWCSLIYPKPSLIFQKFSLTFPPKTNPLRTNIGPAQQIQKLKFKCLTAPLCPTLPCASSSQRRKWAPVSPAAPAGPARRWGEHASQLGIWGPWAHRGAWAELRGRIEKAPQVSAREGMVSSSKKWRC